MSEEIIFIRNIPEKSIYPYWWNGKLINNEEERISHERLLNYLQSVFCKRKSKIKKYRYVED